MTRLNAFSSAACALLLSAALTGCGGTVDFTVDRSLDVNSVVNSGQTMATYDLAAEAHSAWKQRSHISSISITQAEATVTALGAGNTAVNMSGAVWLLPDGATAKTDPGAVKVGDWVTESVTVGNTIGLTLSPELNAFIENAFKGSGKFSVYAEGRAPAAPPWPARSTWCWAAS